MGADVPRGCRVVEVRAEVIAGVRLIRPEVHQDHRGWMAETFRQEWLPPEAPSMVQGNRAHRRAGNLVGMHYHLRQADYWHVVDGQALVNLVDLRASSRSYLRSALLTLGGRGNVDALYIPPGVAHGFYAAFDVTLTYLVDRYYDPEDELGVRWDDPTLRLAWPSREPCVSGRDAALPLWEEVPAHRRPDLVQPALGFPPLTRADLVPHQVG